PLRNAEGEVTGTLAVLGKSARVYTAEEQDLLLVVAGLLRPRLQPASKPLNGQSRTPVSAVRLASQEVKEPLAILRGYADMLNNNEVPPDQMPIVARRLAEQSETLMRIADQVLLLSRLPLELAFTVRVPLDAVAQASAQRIRQRMAGAGMELRLQLDSQAEVWGGARRDAPQRVQARAQRNRRPASPAADDPRSLPVDRQGRRPGNVGRPAGRALQPTGGRATGPWRGARAVPPAAGGRGARGPGLGKQPGGQRHNLLSGTAGGVAGRRYRAGLGRRSKLGVKAPLKKTAPRRTARCDGPPPDALLHGIDEFNRQEFFEQHETLEGIWIRGPHEVRYLYQGILQVGVGFYHWRRGNWRGAVAKLGHGLAKLEPYRPG